MKEGARGLSMWDCLGKVAATPQRAPKQDCYQESSSASDLVLRMLEAGREQSGVRLNARRTQVRTWGQQRKSWEASIPWCSEARPGASWIGVWNPKGAKGEQKGEHRTKEQELGVCRATGRCSQAGSESGIKRKKAYAGDTWLELTCRGTLDYEHRLA